MDIQEFFESKYLKAANLQGRDATVTIAAVEAQQMPDGKTKPCVFFVGKEKGLLLNKVNSMTLADMFGNNTDLWLDKPITLYSANVEFQGKWVPAVRIRNIPPVPTQARQSHARTAPAGVKTHPAPIQVDTKGGMPVVQDDSFDASDEIPF